MIYPILSYLGIGRRRLIRTGDAVQAQVIRCRLFLGLKVKTRPSLYPTDRDFPYRVVTCRYRVNEKTYTVSFLVPAACRYPREGEEVTVFYSPRHPRFAAPMLFAADMWVK